jgi:hypothetical protein
LQHRVTRRLILQKACSRSQMELPHLVDLRFQALFHSPPGVLFTFPSRYLFTIGHRRVFSLTGWSPQIPTRFHVPDRTQEFDGRRTLFAYGTITLYGRTFQSRSAKSALCNSTMSLLQPPCQSPDTGLGFSAFARHYLRNRGFFLFLRVLRCFNSPGWLPCG